MDEKFRMDGGNSVCAGLSFGDDVVYGDLCNDISIFILSMDAGCLNFF